MPKKHTTLDANNSATVNSAGENVADAPEATVPTAKSRAKTGDGKKVGRRDFVKGLVAAGLAGTAATAGGEETQETPTPAAPADAITPADIAAADKLAGRAYTDKQREQMARSLTDIRQNMQALRKGDTDPLLAPAVRFDPQLPGMKFPTGKGSFRQSRVPLPAYDGNAESLAFASVGELSSLIRAGKITSMQLTRMYLERLKRYGPRLLNVVNLTEELALSQAERADREMAAGKYRGALHGIPWGAKDLLATRHIPTTWGAKPYEHQIFDYDATVVERLEAAGAVLVAKLTMGELAMGDVWFGGMTRNPWNTKQGSSGSSAGPGSATAAGLLGFSIGTETLGSIVSPSVRNGVTGLRPTFGRVSRYGAMPLSWTMDKIGPMCRSVEDCALVLNAIYGPDGRDTTVADVPFRWNPNLPLKKLRVGIDQAAFDAVGKETKRAQTYADALAVLHKLGVTPVPIKLPKNAAMYQPIAWLTIDAEGAAAFDKLSASGKLDELAQQEDGSWPNTFRIGSTIPASDYLQAMRLRTRLQQEMAQTFADIDCYVTVPFHGPTLVYTNLTGHPTLITRCGLVEGVPQSIEFVGNLYQEAAILRLGLAYERATNWHTQWPEMQG